MGILRFAHPTLLQPFDFYIKNTLSSYDILIYAQHPSFGLSRQITRDFFKLREEKIDVLVINPAIYFCRCGFIRTLRINSHLQIPKLFHARS